MRNHLMVSLAVLFVFQLARAQVVPNGGFEDWYSPGPLPFEEPVLWTTSNFAGVAGGLPANATKTNDAYKGDFALKLETIPVPGTNDPFIGGAVCIAGLEGHPDKFSGYYKASLMGNDVAGVAVFLKSGFMAIGGGEIEFETSVGEYTYFEFEIEYFLPLDPDSVTITALTSTDEATPGTTLFLDELSFGAVNSTSSFAAPEHLTILWPNPASDRMTVKVPEYEGGVYFTIMDVAGNQISIAFLKSQETIETSSLPGGNYFYKINSEEGLLLDSGKFQILR